MPNAKLTEPCVIELHNHEFYLHISHVPKYFDSFIRLRLGTPTPKGVSAYFLNMKISAQKINVNFTIIGINLF
jgi:hypothetical protein